MKTICAWCGKLIKEGIEQEVSHGICLDCADTFKLSYLENLQEKEEENEKQKYDNSIK